MVLFFFIKIKVWHLSLGVFSPNRLVFSIGFSFEFESIILMFLLKAGSPREQPRKWLLENARVKLPKVGRRSHRRDPLRKGATQKKAVYLEKVKVKPLRMGSKVIYHGNQPLNGDDNITSPISESHTIKM